MNFITNIVKEKGITDIIYNMKAGAEKHDNLMNDLDNYHKANLMRYVLEPDGLAFLNLNTEKGILLTHEMFVSFYDDNITFMAAVFQNLVVDE